MTFTRSIESEPSVRDEVGPVLEPLPRAGDLSTLRRGIEILKLLQQAAHTGEGGLGNNRIASMLGADKSQVSRTLRILVDSGLVAREETTRNYRLGPASYSLGMRAADQELMRHGAAVVRELVRVTGYRAYLVIRDGTQAVTLWSEQPARMVPVINSMGMAYPITETETGRALLFGSSDPQLRQILSSESAEIVEGLIGRVRSDRREGFAWRPGSALESGVAVPVWTTGRRVQAAVGLGDRELAARDRALHAARVLTSAAADFTDRITRKDRRAAQAVPYFGWPGAPSVILGSEP